MPQLDPASFTSQLFWLTVSFVMLYLVLARFVLPRIHDVLQTRQSRLDDDLGRAAAFKDQAEAAKASYEKALHDAKHNAHDMIVKTQAEMAKETANQQALVDAELAKKLSAADASISTARSAALSNLVPITAELAGHIVETLAHHKPSPQLVAQVVNDLAKQKGLV